MNSITRSDKIWRRVTHLSARAKWTGVLCFLALVVGCMIIIQRGVSAPPAESRPNTSPQKGAPKHTNRLIKETSPYLLQHAHNPVDWYPWDKEALERAKREDKPIFLSIGYSTCYWCHVFERESFENQEIAAIMNQHFVCIKVDREERPDLDEIYMTAVQVTTGGGGWPMSVFLTPDLKPFFAGTYFPRDQFERILRGTARLWKDDRTQVESVAQRIADAVKAQVSMDAPATNVLGEAQLKSAVKSFEQDFDSVYGGFGGAPKFPPHQALAFLLSRYRQTKDQSILRMVTVTLDQMARGGDYDQIGGGFHRYSVDARWLVPHFEKMLYDNAQLAPIYAEAYTLTKNPYYRRIAEEVYAFVLREMTSPEGGFYSALDAESYVQKGGHEKEEGAYYVWTPQQVKAVLGKQDGDLFCKIYDITPSGNFEGKSIPNLLQRSVEEWARELKMTPDALWARLDAMRQKLLKAREKRPYPHLDDKVLTSWNALMISSFARGYQVLHEERYREAAEKAARFVLSKLREKDGRLLRTYRAGKAKYNGYLDDYAFLAVALPDLHEATGDVQWLREAEATADKMLALFWDKENGGFFFTSSDHPEQLLARSKSAFDGAEPSGNSMAALALLRLGRLTGRSDPIKKSQDTLQTFGGFLTRAPRGFGMMLLTLDTFLTESKKPLVVKASTSSAQSEDVVRAEVEPAQITLKAGQPSELKVRIHIKKGWHINSNRPTLDFLVPTKLNLSSSLPVQLKQVQYPKGKRIKLGFAEDELDVYEDGVTLTALVEATGRGTTSSGTLQLVLSYQACDDKQCLRPSSLTLSVPTKVVPSH